MIIEYQEPGISRTTRSRTCTVRARPDTTGQHRTLVGFLGPLQTGTKEYGYVFDYGGVNALYYVTDEYDLDESVHQCHQLGMHIPAPNTLEQYESLKLGFLTRKTKLYTPYSIESYYSQYSIDYAV